VIRRARQETRALGDHDGRVTIHAFNMARVEAGRNAGVDRRTFVLANLALATGVSAQGSSLETFTQWLDASHKTREAALQPSVERIRSRDGEIHAWVQVLPQKPTRDGALSHIPFGVKDIIETKGLATEYGSPIYKGRIGTTDAAIVRELRQRGGVLLGKTHTTAFAYRTPGPTRNPRDLAHTPGGSSSGSAAAVAAGMVPFALGTQTRGSVLRPASYCGVTGFKPTYGLLPMEGVLPFAKSLDTLGLFTQTPAEMLKLWATLGYSEGRPEDLSLGTAEPRLEVEPAMERAFQAALSRLRDAGAVIRPVAIAEMLNKLDEASNVVMFYEGARFHEQRFKEYGSRLADMADLVREGLKIPVEKYNDARRFVADCQARMTELFKATPVILVPAATGPAPLGLASTGDPRMNAPWTALGTPAISIPLPVSNALPLGLQLTASHGEDARVIQTAVRLAKWISN
jgi:Asp-tRNA(Asn)/Glu-tRNA(Gln) amidotransferase A subunit family amidase